MIIITPMKDRKSSPRMRLRSNIWEVEELKFELRLCACNHHTILGRENKRVVWKGKGKRRAWGGLAMWPSVFRAENQDWIFNNFPVVCDESGCLGEMVWMLASRVGFRRHSSGL